MKSESRNSHRSEQLPNDRRLSHQLSPPPSQVYAYATCHACCAYCIVVTQMRAVCNALARIPLRRCRRRRVHASAPRARNRLLFECEELSDCGGQPSAVLRAGDPRATHISQVLRAEPGHSLRVGVVNGQRSTATLVAGAVSGEWRLLWQAHAAEPALARPTVDVLLALPRPKEMRRLWAPLAALGVGALFLTNAAKVERFYYDAVALEPGAVRSELLRGLEQAADTQLPTVLLSKRFPPILDAAAGRRPWPVGVPWAQWLVGGVEGLPARPSILLVAHPHERALSVSDALLGCHPATRVLLAVGPEGGWTSHELDLMLADTGFGGARAVLVSLGPRTLTTGTALISLLAAVKEVTRTW